MKKASVAMLLVALATACGRSGADDDGNELSGIETIDGDGASVTSPRALKGFAGKCLTAGASNGAYLTQQDCDGSAAQLFTFDNQQLKDGRGKCVDVSYNRQGPGAYIQSYDCFATDAQRWRFDGGKIISTAGYCLAVNDWNRDPGAQVGMWWCEGGENQVWSWSGSSSAPSSPSPTSPPPATGGKLIRAVYVGNDPAAAWQYDRWLGQPADAFSVTTGYADRSDYRTAVSWIKDQYDELDRDLIWSVPIMAKGSTLSQAARGDYDADWRYLAERIAEYRDSPKIYIRTGWEFNGSWFYWNAIGQPETFKQAFRRFVQTFRSVSNRFVFEWNVNWGREGIAPETCYPGDDVVDIIGMDVYWKPEYTTYDPVQAWEIYKTRPYGLDWHASFAEAHDKPMAYSEWGIETDNAGPFIRNFATWMATHNVVYESYWDSDADYPGKLSAGRSPNAGAAYRDAFTD